MAPTYPAAALLLVSALLLAVPGHALTFGPRIEFPTNASGRNPQLATDGAGTWIAVWSSFAPHTGLGSDADILYSVSSDDGASWSSHTNLDPAATSDSFDDDHPVAVHAGAGVFLVAWRSNSDLGGTIGTDQDILFMRSTDGGLTWSPQAEALNPDAATDTGIQDRRPKLASDGAGSVVAVWEINDPDTDVAAIRSTDSGASWSSAVAVNSDAAIDSEGDIEPNVATDGTGNWITVWESRNTTGGFGADSDIFFAHSTDTGATWSARASVQTQGTTDSGNDERPRLATDGSGTWIATWQSNEDLGGTAGTDLDLFYARTTNLGATWSPTAALNTNADSDTEVDDLVEIAANGGGTWLAFWRSRTDLGGIGTDFDPFYARSGDDGVSWPAPTAIFASQNLGETELHVAADGTGRWLIGWQTREALSCCDPGADFDTVLSFADEPDTDGDGLFDALETNVHGTDPLLADTDADGLDDGDEIGVHGTDPLLADTDGDGLSDGDEVNVHATDPLDADPDSDGLDDGTEVLTTFTDPFDPDTDGDGLDDGTEVNVTLTDPNLADSDGDSLSDGDEVNVHGTNPNATDTDADGFDDDVEISVGSLATDLASTPLTIAPLLVRASPDVTLDLASTYQGATPADEDVAIDTTLGVIALGDLGALPVTSDVVALAVDSNGDRLFSLASTTELSGGLVAWPRDVVRYDDASYTLEFDGLAAGVPTTASVDAVSLGTGVLLLSFDVTLDLGGVVAADEDLVSWDGAAFALALDASAAGIDPALDLDAAHDAGGGALRLSFDGGGEVGGVRFGDEDVLHFDGVAWGLAYDASLANAAWQSADLDAVSFVPEPGAALSLVLGALCITWLGRRRR